GRDDDLDEDLSDLFESLNSEKESESSEEEDDFEDLFKEEAGKDESKPSAAENKQAEDSAEDDFLRDFLDDEDDQDLDLAGKKDQDDDIADIDDLISDLNEEKEELQDQPEEADAEARQASPEPGEQKDIKEEPDLPDSEPEVEAESEVEPEAEEKPEAEPEPQISTEPEEEPEPEEEEEQQAAPQDDIQAPGQDKLAEKIEILTSQLESVSSRMDIFEERLDNIENSVSEKAVEAIEEKGPELGFLKKMLEDLKQELVPDTEQGGQTVDQPPLEIAEEDFKAAVVEAVEEKGADLSFILDLKDKISEYADKVMEEKFAGLAQPGEDQEDSELSRRIKDLEDKIQEISIPDAEEMRQEIRADCEKLIEDRIGNTEKKHVSPKSAENEPESQKEEAPEIDEWKQEINRLVEDRINNLVDSWQSEKKALASELENALKFWGKMQEKLTVLSQDIGELRDQRAELDPDLLEKFESINELAVTRKDLRNLAHQLKVELEEYIMKKVPEAAARVIRQEIAAILQEKK
ncbi:MAG: hypothetical protein ACLFPY_08125, partial [Desulfonatronovibrio sp.]